MSARDGWRRVKFGEIAENVAVRVDDPSQAGVERYVGLEHLDPESLAITRWGQPTDVGATKLRFWPGDIIFGRRRAYQRKLAVADFEGICSAHALVLRAKSDVAAPEFLPFFMQSDTFFDRALSISVGSLSPTINWKTLREQEFDLPPIDEQREIAELLWAVESLIGHLESVRATIDSVLQSSLDAATASARLTTLGAYLERIEAGKSPAAAGRAARQDEFGVLKVSAVGDGIFRTDENKALLRPDDFHAASEVRAGDLLVSRANASISGVARPCIVDEVRPGLMLSDKTLRLVPRDGVSSHFLFLTMRSVGFRRHVRLSANGTEAKNISQAKLRRGPVPDLEPTAQLRLVSELDEKQVAAGAVDRELEALRHLTRNIRREVGM